MELLEWRGQGVPLLPPPPLVGPEGEVITRDVFQLIKNLKAQGLGTRKIAAHLGIDRQTVRSYLAAPEFMPYSRQGPLFPSLAELDGWLKERFPEVGGNAHVLFREAQEKGFEGCYETIKRFVRPLRDTLTAAALASVRFETAPGQQGQVDWGSAKVFFEGGPKRVHLFVMVLGFSRRMFAHGYDSERRKHVIDGHLRAFEWFGGYPREILYDNARTMIMTEKSEEDRLNKVFKDFAKHYGFEPRFCRPYRPRTKGKVESGVKYLKRNFLAGRRFRDLDHLNVELERWLREVADTRIHGTTHHAPIARFADEKPALNPIHGVRPWQPDLDQERKVANDGHVTFQTNRYPVSLDQVGETVKVRVESDVVHIRNEREEIARHTKISGKFQHAPGGPTYQPISSPTGKKSVDQPPQHDPRWLNVEVETRDLAIYDIITQPMEVA